jgi:hypothetical protein
LYVMEAVASSKFSLVQARNTSPKKQDALRMVVAGSMSNIDGSISAWTAKFASTLSRAVTRTE